MASAGEQRRARNQAGGLLARARRALVRPRGDEMWDAVVRGTGAAGLLGIGLVWLLPASGPLVGLGIFTLWISGPLSPLFPVGLEPVLMLFGRLYPPWLVAGVCMLAGVYIEFLSYHLYGYVAGREAARPVRESRLGRWARDVFAGRPFLATWFCAWSPVPFWVARFLAPLSDYPISRYLAANVLGRYPKLWLFASLGVWWNVSDRLLLGLAAACLLLGPVVWLSRQNRESDAADGPEDPSRPAAGTAPTGGRGAPPVEILYIAGIGRSGSTVLGRILGGHRDHVPVGELMRICGRGVVDNEFCSCGEPARSCEFWGEVFERLEARIGLDAGDAAELSRLRRRMTEGSAAVLTLSPWKPDRVRRRLDRLRVLARHSYRAVRDVSGAEVLVDASKNLAWGRLLIGTPGIRVRVLHLIRDSRGVVHSFGKTKRRRGSREDGELMTRYGPATTSLLWNVDNLLAERLGRGAEDYTRLRYRDFVRSPGRAASAVLENGAGPPDSSHVDGRSVELGRQHVLTGNPVRFQDGTITLQEDVAWRDAMGAGTRGLVTALTAPLLRRYGYLGDGNPGSKPRTA